MNKFSLIATLFVIHICSCIAFQIPLKSTHVTHSKSATFASQELHFLPESENFDSDFANSISKPLPQWFIEEEKARTKLKQELEEKSRRLLEEFRAKYLLTEIEKATMAAKIREEKKLKRKQRQSYDWFGSLFEKSSVDESVDEEELTTKEKWDIFLNEEKKATGFDLPGFFDIFPELNFKWPVWSKRNGKAIQCETDSDCQLPQTCCAHPIIPGDKFCCTGWGRRVMVPAYQTQTIKPDVE